MIVLDTGDNEEELRKSFKMPDDDEFRQAVHYFMTPPTHEYVILLTHPLSGYHL